MRKLTWLMVASFGLSVGAHAQENVTVETDGVKVEVNEDGSVKVKAGGAEVQVGDSGVGVEVQAQGAHTGGVLSVDGVERIVRHTCDAAHARTVRVNGTDNRVILTGACDAVIVSGTDNDVKVESVGRIVVDGVDNKISYRQGLGGKPPTVQKTGVDNKVFKRKQ